MKKLATLTILFMLMPVVASAHGPLRILCQQRMQAQQQPADEDSDFAEQMAIYQLLMEEDPDGYKYKVQVGYSVNSLGMKTFNMSLVPVKKLEDWKQNIEVYCGDMPENGATIQPMPMPEPQSILTPQSKRKIQVHAGRAGSVKVGRRVYVRWK